MAQNHTSEQLTIRPLNHARKHLLDSVNFRIHRKQRLTLLVPTIVVHKIRPAFRPLLRLCTKTVSVGNGSIQCSRSELTRIPS